VEAEGPKAQAFITVVCSPKEVILCGTKTACRNIIGMLRCFAAPLDEANWFHTPVLAPWREEMRRPSLSRGIHIREGLPIAVYAGSGPAFLGTGVEEFADERADALLRQADLPAVLRRAYAGGCRVFIDLASMLNEVDYRTVGRTAEKLGLAGLNTQELLALVSDF
jgi:hypothetical protein